MAEDSAGAEPEAGNLQREVDLGNTGNRKLIAGYKALIANLHQQTDSWTASINDADKPFVELVQNGNRPIDLSSLEAGQQIRLSVLVTSAISSVTVANVARDVIVEVWFPQRAPTSLLRSIELQGIDGHLELTGLPNGVDLDAHSSSGLVVIGTDVEISLTGAGDPAPCFRVRGGRIDLRDHLPRVEVEGSVVLGTAVASNGGKQGRIGDLVAVGDAEVTLTFPPLRIDRVRRASEDVTVNAAATLTLRAFDNNLQGSRNRLIRIGEIECARVAGTPGVRLECQSIKNATLVAPIELELPDGAIVTDTSFRPAGNEWVTLASKPGAAVLSGAGHIELRKVAQLQLSASAAGIEVRDSGSTNASSDVDWKGTVLTGVTLPGGLEGRRTLTRLTDAYQFSPDVRRLPGRDQTALARLTNRRKVRYTEGVDQVRRLHADAEYLREMTRVCKEKGAPGSVTTQVAWCAYRLRALKARGLERAALAVYRCIGYGERPGPAFLLWLVLSLVLAGPVLFIEGAHWDPHGGVDNFLLEVGRLMVGPLAVLTRSGSLDSRGDFAEIVARILTAIPLLTGAIALRNYVKAER